MLADKVIAAAATDRPAFHQWAVRHIERLAKCITEAERFVVSHDATGAIEEVLDQADSAALRLLEVCRTPFRSCWIEWPDEEGNRTGVLMQSDDDGQRGTCMFAGWLADSRDLAVLPVIGSFDWRQTEDIYDHLDRQRMAFWPDVPEPVRTDFDMDVLHGAVFVNLAYVQAVVVLLHTRNVVDTERQVISEKLQRARRKSGKPPLLEHTRIDIALSERMARREADGTDPRNPVRLHAVRRHLRFWNNRLIWVRAHMRGRFGQGVITQQTRVLH